MNHITLLILSIPAVYLATLTKLEDIAITNQRDLYLKYKIKEITIKDGLTTKIYLDDSCYFKELKQFCGNNKLMEQQIFGLKNQNDKIISYDLNCTGMINYESYYSYENGLIKQRINKSDDILYASKTVTFYDSLNRVIKKVYYGYGDKYIKSWEERTYDSSPSYTEIRFDHDTSILITSVVILDSNGMETQSDAFYQGALTSRYTSEYDKFGNRTHYIGHFYPSRKFILEERNYYNNEGKIDSSIYNHSSADTKTYFFYDKKGFLTKSEYIHNGNKSVTKYSYK
jgi:hypothetical protein